MAGDLINKKACKEFALKWAKEQRRGWTPTRVSGQYLDDINSKIRLLIQGSINSHRSVGKTITDFL